MNTMEALNKLSKDEALCKKTRDEAKTPEALFEVLQGIGLTDSFEEFKKTAAELNDSLSQLTPEELETVAGGGTSTTTTTITTAIPLAAAAPTALAACI